MNPNGWLIGQTTSAGFILTHSSGFYIAGFESRYDAAYWLSDLLLKQQAQQHKAERDRLRILARMPAHGQVS